VKHPVFDGSYYLLNQIHLLIHFSAEKEDLPTNQGRYNWEGACVASLFQDCIRLECGKHICCGTAINVYIFVKILVSKNCIFNGCILEKISTEI